LNENILQSLHVTAADEFLVLDLERMPALINDSANRANDHIWSSDMLFNHLNMLDTFASPVQQILALCRAVTNYTD